MFFFFLVLKCFLTSHIKWDKKDTWKIHMNEEQMNFVSNSFFIHKKLLFTTVVIVKKKKFSKGIINNAQT